MARQDGYLTRSRKLILYYYDLSGPAWDMGHVFYRANRTGATAQTDGTGDSRELNRSGPGKRPDGGVGDRI